MGVVLMFLIGMVLCVAGIWYWRRHAHIEPVPGFALTESDNSAQSLYERGMAYRRGQDLELDFQAARRLLRRAAGMNHVLAQYEYGLMLDRGLGGGQDQGRGLRWMEHAAKGGCVEARLQMGQRYYAGEGVETNLARAEQYLRSAAESGLAEAQTALGLLYRDSAPPLENPERAVDWLSRAVNQRHGAAFFPLSDLYERGVGVPRDLKKADELLRQAAELGVPQAQLRIARHYLTGASGHAFPQDYRMALGWFKRAAGHGIAEAQYEVGVRYEQNEGVDAPDMAVAIESYLGAAEAGFAPAQHRLGQIYLYGQGVNQNLREARRWFSAAAQQGHAAAARHLQKLQGHVAEPSVPDKTPDHEPDWKG
jgi:uncharacterized protein